MSKPHKVQFTSGRGVIEVEFTRDGTGLIQGEAYFRGDDMGATIVDGEFKHPMWDTHYRILGPAGKSQTLVLQTIEWRNVDEALPYNPND